MQKELKEKLETVVELVNNGLIDPDIQLSYCIPEVSMTADTCNVSGDPYIHLKYIINGTHTMEQNIPIKNNYLKKTPEDIANLVTFYIELWCGEIDTVEYGAQ